MILFFLVFVIGVSCDIIEEIGSVGNSSSEGQGTKYIVLKLGAKCKCYVEVIDAARVGSPFLGPYNSREQAYSEMCKQYDQSMTD